MGNPWKVTIELSHRGSTTQRQRQRHRCAGTPLVVRRARRKKGVGGVGEGNGRAGGWMAGWLAWHRGWKVKREKIKYIPGHWRDFVSYILFEPIGFIYAAGCRIRGGAGGRLKCRAAGKAVSLLFHPHHALSVSGTGRFYCIFNSTLFIHVPFWWRQTSSQIFQRGWTLRGAGNGEIFVEKFIATTRIPTISIWNCFPYGFWKERFGPVS